jgi:hypothetical protein
MEVALVASVPRWNHGLSDSTYITLSQKSSLQVSMLWNPIYHGRSMMSMPFRSRIFPLKTLTYHAMEAKTKLLVLGTRKACLWSTKLAKAPQDVARLGHLTDTNYAVRSSFPPQKVHRSLHDCHSKISPKTLCWSARVKHPVREKIKLP